MVVVDAGYGVVGLGASIMARTDGRPGTINLVLTHLHWDHIQGLPFFIPVYVPGVRLIIHSVSAKTARQAMERLFTSIYSPIMGVENLGAQIQYAEIGAGCDFGGARLAPIILEHGVPTLGLRLEEDGVVMCHATDHESGVRGSDGRLVEAARGADLLIHDAQFTEREYRHRRGWGHSDTSGAVSNALAAGVRRLVLFHYDPNRTDHEVDAQIDHARKLANGALEVRGAAEGTTLEISADR
jgi:ribonuclease BN (tRNA processing enzyme)